MSIFDCPVARCEFMRTMVITDQTQAQCAHENGCPPGVDCPLAGCFSGLEWADNVRAGGACVAAPAEAAAAPHRRRRATGSQPQVRRAA